MASSLPRGAPEDQQVDPAAILRFLDAVQDHPGVEMHSLMVLRHGHVVAEGWWAPYSAERPQLLYSLSKSFTATAAAFAQAEGLLDLDGMVTRSYALEGVNDGYADMLAGRNIRGILRFD